MPDQSRSPGPWRRLRPDPRAWDDLVAANPAGGFMQTTAWAELQGRQGVQVRQRAWGRGGRLEGGAIFHAARSLDGPGMLACPGGPVLPWDDPETARDLFRLVHAEARRLMRETGALFWRIEPRLPAPPPEWLVDAGFVRAPVDLDPFETREIDLTGGLDAVLDRMTPKGRYNVRLAQRHGVTVTIDDQPTAARRFYPLLVETAQRRKFLAEPLCYHLDLAATLFPVGQAVAAFASHDGTLLAGAIAVFHGPRATYLYGGSRDVERRRMAPYALQAALMAEAIRRGCTVYDLYGIDAVGRPDHAYRKLSQFKARFGGQARVYAGAHDLYDYQRLADAMIPWLSRLAREEEPACPTSP